MHGTPTSTWPKCNQIETVRHLYLYHSDSLDKSSARSRQTEQNLMTMAYASCPLMLAIDRHTFHIPLEERLQGRTSDLAAWTKTMLPTIRLSISEAQNQLRTDHQDIRTYCFTRQRQSAT